MNSVLAVDVGGQHVKVLASGQRELRRVTSGPRLRPEQMVEAVLTLVDGWRWDQVSIGIPGVILAAYGGGGDAALSDEV